MARGIFLSLDGIDGAGKSTQCRLLADWLREQGRAVTVCRDPGGTPTGDRIRDILLHSPHPLSPVTEAFLFMASRTQLVEEVIRPALHRGDVVLTDRFVLATVVYQGHAGVVPIDQLWRMGELATGGVLPELNFILDLPVAASQQRKTGQLDRMESKGTGFMEQVRLGFLAEARRRPEHIIVIPADRPEQAVQQDLRREVSRVLAKTPRP